MRGSWRWLRLCRMTSSVDSLPLLLKSHASLFKMETMEPVSLLPPRRASIASFNKGMPELASLFKNSISICEARKLYALIFLILHLVKVVFKSLELVDLFMLKTVKLFLDCGHCRKNSDCINIFCLKCLRQNISWLQ